MKEAKYYIKGQNNKVNCLLCPHQCIIQSGQIGRCGVRRNLNGTLDAQTYGQCASLALDPIEKKPLYHFYPGSLILSVGTKGCNFSCSFCQNYELAHGTPKTNYLKPDQLVLLVQEKAPESIGLAFTYNEPLVWYEYVLDTAKLAGAQGLKNVLVTNGFIQEEPLKELLPYVDAFNIDLKGFTAEYYKKLVGGNLEAVKDTIVRAKDAGCHVEVTTLLVTGQNDSEQEVKQLASWLAAAAGRDIPLHLSRYFPRYKMADPPTPLETMKTAYEAAKDELRYVYLGNAPELNKSNTFCPFCDAEIVNRDWGKVEIVNLDGNKCTICGHELEIVV